MTLPDLDGLLKAVKTAAALRDFGRVAAVRNGFVVVSGLGHAAKIGDCMRLENASSGAVLGEVLQIDNDTANLLPDRVPAGIAVGDRAVLLPPDRLRPSQHWIGRVITPDGRPLDGFPLLGGDKPVAIDTTAPPAGIRRLLGERLETGQSALNTVLPIVRGQRVGLFAGSGVGKSHLLAHLAQHMQADVVVIALIGERGREVSEFVQKTLGPEGLKRAVVVAATSDQSPSLRRRCAWSAMAIAEFFRDLGQHVILLADSITRFAEAHREIATISGEPSTLRGFPPSTTPLITGLCERAGQGAGTGGDITAVITVLVAGSDMDEPVADILRGVLDGHVVLSRDIAERGRYPAIDVSRSVSRALPDAASADENQMILETRRLLGAYEQSEVMIRAGLYTAGSDPLLDRAMKVWPDLDGFFARREPDGIANSFNHLALILRRAGTP